MGLTIVLKKVFNEQLLDGKIVECVVECPTCGGEGGEWGPSSLFAGYDECWHRCPRCDGDGWITVPPEQAEQIEQEHEENRVRATAEFYLERRYRTTTPVGIQDFWSR